ncbi:hypothetical protein EYF80_028743 [Liparis tanakae]|uniref:Uncharacterized protein n=1 Tax=Liparis tanakae TaxID=230148 RepID=A0A4Z2H6E6_9TELE|nr:hypothetical protein EYF80_028743 [Liparis tanakae]
MSMLMRWQPFLHGEEAVLLNPSSPEAERMLSQDTAQDFQKKTLQPILRDFMPSPRRIFSCFSVSAATERAR